MNRYRTETTGVLREPASGTRTWPKLSRENGCNASKAVAPLPGQRHLRPVIPLDSELPVSDEYLVAVLTRLV